MSPTGILGSIFTEEVIKKWRIHPSTSKALSHRIDVITASGPEPSDDFMACKLKYWRAQKAAWEAYITAAHACGFFDDDDGRDLIKRITGIDDDNFRSALAECKACWFFAGKLHYKVIPRPFGRNGRKLDLLVQIGDSSLYVEVKAPYKEFDEEGFWDDDFVKISSCVGQANKQFAKRKDNILFIAPELRFKLYYSRYNLIKALYGRKGISIVFNNTTGEAIGDPYPVFNPNGRFLNRILTNGKLGTPGYTRLGAVVSFEEAYGKSQLPSKPDLDDKIWIYHKVLVAHNPFASNPISKEIWRDCIQLVPENNTMRWTDNYNTP
jgi:hypothetical protein